jgi:hypothetical protein
MRVPEPNDTRQLWQRIADAEWMTKAGYSFEQILEQTRLSKITAHCTVSRVRFGMDFSGLKRNRKDD